MFGVLSELLAGIFAGLGFRCAFRAVEGDWTATCARNLYDKEFVRALGANVVSKAVDLLQDREAPA